MSKRLFYFLIIFLLGCISQEDPVTTTTSTTLPPDPHQVLHNKLYNVLEWPDEINPKFCKDVSIENVIYGECTECYELLYSLECFPDGGDKSFMYGVSFKIENYRLIESKINWKSQRCFIDADCIPPQPGKNINYFCRDRLCVKSDLVGEQFDLCKRSGNHVESRSLPNGIIIYQCVYNSGSVCEIEALNRGYCNEYTENLTICPQTMNILCRNDYIPVCGLMNLSDGRLIWRDFDNKCIACKQRSLSDEILGYVYGNCVNYEIINFEVKGVSEEQKFCEENGYTFLIRKYATGTEYGLCVFDIDDECTAQDYMRGLCKPID